MFNNVILVGLGGAAGSIARFLCQKWIYAWLPSPFPWGTFTVNISGCFLIGLFYALSEKGNLLSPELRILLTTGFCGGFTTFSTFSYEGIQLLKSADYTFFFYYTLGSVLLGILAAYLGMFIIKLL